jgi:8-oxo-dGTP pyrophosphatase MutT (NUDIX family)
MTEAIIPQLKYRLTRPLPGKETQLKMAPSFRPDLSPRYSDTKAGVLLLLYPNPNELYLVLTKRPVYQGTHSGQISFPGGKFDPSDKSFVETALRETQEEIGITRHLIEIIGQLTPLYIPVSEIEVFPTVGFTEIRPIFHPDPHEVEFLIEVPLSTLLNPAIKEIKPFESEKFNGIIPYFNIENNHVWGATAMILSEFLEIVRES